MQGGHESELPNSRNNNLFWLLAWVTSAARFTGGALVSKAATLLASNVKSFASHPARVAAQMTERKNKFRFIRKLYHDPVGLFSPNFSSRDNGRRNFAFEFPSVERAVF